MNNRSTATAGDTPAPASSSRSGLLVLLDLAIIAALIILPLSFFFDPLEGAWGRVSWNWKPLVAPWVLILARALAKARLIRAGRLVRGLFESLLLRKLTFAWVMTFGFFIAAEAGLAFLGVEKTAAAPIVIRGEEAMDTKVKENDAKVISDPELLWRFVPGINWDHVRINEHGYRTRSFTWEKAAGSRRVIALGDSCTAQGQPPYSDRLHELLQKNAPTPQPWEAFNMGVFGYSIEQGYRQFVKEGSRLQPDVVTIYFGWNDHWLFDKPDRLRLAKRLSPAQATFVRAIQEKRLFSVLTRNIKQTGGREKGAPKSRDFRVPPDHYTQTLSNLVSAIRGVGAQPLIITAARRELTPAIVKSGHANSEDVAEVAHDRYVEMTRQVADSLQVPVLDLAREFFAPEFDAYFMKDGIHFDDAGLQVIAERLHARLMELAAAGQFSPSP